MNNVYTLPNQQSREQIEDEASIWIARIDRTLSPTEIRELKAWVKADANHKQVLFEMAALWDEMSTLSRLSDLFPSPVKDRRMFPRAYLAVAASFLLFFVTSFLMITGEVGTPWDEPPKDVAVVDGHYETSVGEHSTVRLPDGSQLILNTNSFVKVTYTAQHRLFVLERGEINIEVAHDTSRPLSVLAGDKMVQAVGTAFNVHVFSDREIELIVTDGKVLVADRVKQEPSSELTAPVRLAGESLAVSKGEKVILGSAEQLVDKIAENDIVSSLSWRQGNLVFRGETLEEVIDEISRYTAVEFVIADEKIKDLRIAGLFKAGDVSGLLQTLRQNFQINSEKVDEDNVILTIL